MLVRVKLSFWTPWENTVTVFVPETTGVKTMTSPGFRVMLWGKSHSLPLDARKRTECATNETACATWPGSTVRTNFSFLSYSHTERWFVDPERELDTIALFAVSNADMFASCK